MNKNKNSIIVLAVFLITFVVFNFVQPPNVFHTTSVNELLGEDLKSNNSIKLRMLHWDNFLEAGKEINIDQIDNISVLLRYLEGLELNEFMFNKKIECQKY